MKNLRELRRSVGLSQAELARRTGIARARLCYAEQGLQLTAKEEGSVLAVIAKMAEENRSTIRKVLNNRVLEAATA
jgi:transcriptional regulator with XRE-family HTH domain